MTPIEWRTLLPGDPFYAPFSAKKRSSARILASPIVLHVKVPYRQWDGPIGPWSEHFGKGKQQVHSIDGSEPKRSCNEVEIVKLFRRAGWCAFWVSCYNPSKLPAIWQPFAVAPFAMQFWLKDIDRRVREHIPHRTGGIPDVAAWVASDPAASVVFVECKGPTEPFKDNQEDWVAGAICEGFATDRFGVAIRSFM